MHELRKDPLLNRWVVVLKDSMPPDYYREITNIAKKDFSPKDCPLCMENKHLKEIFSIRDNSNRWFTKVIPSINPIFQIECDLGRKGIGMYDKMNSVGANEIIIESSDHNKPSEEVGIDQFIRVIKTYKNRISELEKDPRLRYTFIYKDTGKSAEKFHFHPHSQVISTPVIPKGIKEELDGARSYFQYKERCIFCDVLNEELRMEKRIIMESRNFVSFVPFAPSSAFDFWLLPKRHNCAFQDIDEDEIEDLSLVLVTLIKKIKKLFKDLSYSYIIHSAPNRMPRRNHWHTLGEDFHWHIEVMLNLTTKNNFEWNSEFCLLTTSPEDAAKYIKEA
jgi:UDPglucose--hexose-1-phosphate uridylyltransferase